VTLLNYLAIAVYVCAVIALVTHRVAIRGYFALMVLSGAVFLADGLWHGDVPEIVISVLGCAAFARLWWRGGHCRGRAAAGRRRRTEHAEH
jgi:hypothetical protein